MHFTKINLLNHSPVSLCMSVPCDIFLYFVLLRVTINVLCSITFFFQDLLLPYVRGGSVQRSDPVPFYIPFLEEYRWSLSFGTPPFSGQKIWSLKMFTKSLYLLPAFWVPKTGFHPHSGDTLAIKKWLTTKIVDMCSLVTMPTAFKTWINSLLVKSN